jgi:hypothetical protein
MLSRADWSKVKAACLRLSYVTASHSHTLRAARSLSGAASAHLTRCAAAARPHPTLRYTASTPHVVAAFRFCSSLQLSCSVVVTFCGCFRCPLPSWAVVLSQPRQPPHTHTQRPTVCDMCTYPLPFCTPTRLHTLTGFVAGGCVQVEKRLKSVQTFQTVVRPLRIRGLFQFCNLSLRSFSVLFDPPRASSPFQLQFGEYSAHYFAAACLPLLLLLLLLLLLPASVSPGMRMNQPFGCVYMRVS